MRGKRKPESDKPSTAPQPLLPIQWPATPAFSMPRILMWRRCIMLMYVKTGLAGCIEIMPRPILPGHALTPRHTNKFPMKHRQLRLKIACCLLAGLAIAKPVLADQRIATIARVKSAVVAIATLHKTRVPALEFIGSGFMVGDGLTVVTNAHVVKTIGIADANEVLGIITGNGTATDFREAKLVNSDAKHDLAQLKISGTPLPVLKIGNSDSVQEGQSLLFTGFPLGMVLGFHHVTHRAMVSAITPVAIPAMNAHGLNARIIKRLRDDTYPVFQLDGTAYPGNSGSPLYDPETGEVFGIINKVFVKGTKEAALSQPSGITYAIPGRFILELLGRDEH